VALEEQTRVALMAGMEPQTPEMVVEAAQAVAAMAGLAVAAS